MVGTYENASGGFGTIQRSADGTTVYLVGQNVGMDILDVRTPASPTLAGLGSATAKINYLEIPLLFRALIPTGASVTPTLFVGPVPAVQQVSCSTTTEAQGTSVSEDCGDDDGLKNFDVGLLFGGGFEAAVSPTVGITGELRYNLGLTNLDDSDLDDTFRNRTLSVIAGFVVWLPQS